MKLQLKIITIALTIVAATYFVACAAPKVEPEPQLQIIEHNLSMHSFASDVLKSIATVDGKAKNTGTIKINSASITVKFYDKEGNFLNTASTVKENLEAGEIWSFNVQFTSPDAWKTVRYDISASVK